MSRSLRRRALTGIGLTAGLAGLAITGSLAYAAAGDGPVITACLDKKGSVRVVDSAAQCRVDETSISWNKEGPVGPAGQKGVDGKDGSPGATGPQGPAGASAKLAGGSGAFGIPGTVSCTGTKQGALVGDGPGGTSVVQAADYAVLSPFDTTSGQSTGKRQYKPLTITKQIDQASPKYFSALVTNEVLTACTFDFFETAPDGTSHVSYRIKLSQARVTEDAFSKGDTRLGNAGPLSEYEQITFTFRTIQVTYVPAGTTAQDDWNSDK